ncbi:hypothetical protein K474DRAFT_680576 [Panus rudis PR-1116 ss-1]|nr:hypothetical protein K474DRAFT_680576 [Panus rudis PR-1116 ss-1]
MLTYDLDSCCPVDPQWTPVCTKRPGDDHPPARRHHLLDARRSADIRNHLSLVACVGTFLVCGLWTSGEDAGLQAHQLLELNGRNGKTCSCNEKSSY